MTLQRRRFLSLATSAGALAVVSAARAQTYPTRPVRIVVGVAAGSAPDIFARLIGQWLSDRLGQQFVVENRPGGGTNIATEAVVRASPDGNTLLLVAHRMRSTRRSTTSSISIFFAILRPSDRLSNSPEVLVVHPSVPAGTIPELVAHAKANPGKPEHGVSRCRVRPAYVRRAVQLDGRHQHDPRALSWRGPGA